MLLKSIYLCQLRLYFCFSLETFGVNPFARAECDTVNFDVSLTGLNSVFAFWIVFHAKVKEPSLPLLFTHSERLFGFISLLIVLCEMQTASYRIWTLTSVPIFYDSNYYTMNISIILIVTATVVLEWKYLFIIFKN